MSAIPASSVSMKRIYIAGPMTGLPDFNYPAFNSMAAELRAQGHHVENPAENPKSATWEAYMRLAITQLMTCDTIVLLPGWGDSVGAGIECRLADDLDIVVVLAHKVELIGQAA